jgi:carbonic anhydrase
MNAEDERMGMIESPRVDRRTLLKLAVGGAAILTAGGAYADATSAPKRPVPKTPAEALAALRDGNQRFVDHKPEVRSTEEIERIWTVISAGQAPFATVLGCADSRLAPELIFDQFFGDIFVIREAGNIANSATNLGSLEYGQAVLGSKALLVLGHSSCGAVKAAFEGATPGGNIQSIIDVIKPAIAGAADLDAAIIANVRAVIATVREKSPLLRQAESDGKMSIVGAVYKISTGVVTFLA